MRGAPPLRIRTLMPLLQLTVAAARHAAASGLAGAEQPVEDALDVVDFFLVGDVVLEPPSVQHGLQLAIETAGSAAVALGRAARVADGSSAGSSREACDVRSTSPGLGGVLRAFKVAVGKLARSGARCESILTSGEARPESARPQAWDAAWLGQSIAELCATAEACERLAVGLVPSLADGRMLAAELGGSEACRLALGLASHSLTFVPAHQAQRQQKLGQLGQEDRRALLRLSLTAAKALALPPAQLRICMFGPERALDNRFMACQSSLSCLAYLAMARQPALAVDQR